MKRLAPLYDTSTYQGGVWPTEAQQLLLQAALLDAPTAINAWAAWQEMVQTDALDRASWMLIPLVYVNLRRLGVEDPLLLQAKGHHLDTWRSNQRFFQTASAFLQELNRLEIPVLVLKGVALANLYYPDTGCRPMADLDILVPAGRFLAMGEELLQQGWKETDGHSLSAFRMDRMPSFGFMRPDGFWVDLHCHVLHANCARDADDEFWAHAQSWTLRQTTALTLAPEDQLLHVVSHGVRWCDVPHLSWIADAWWILARAHGGFDWERFLRQARFHKISLPLFRGLEFMNRIIPLDLPAGLLARLEAIPVSADSRVRFIVETNPIPRSFLPRARWIWKALGEDEAARRDDGQKRAPSRGTLSLLLFACKIVVRDRKQILAELYAWLFSRTKSG